jgi:hypothetical protein
LQHGIQKIMLEIPFLRLGKFVEKFIAYALDVEWMSEGSPKTAGNTMASLAGASALSVEVTFASSLSGASSVAVRFVPEQLPSFCPLLTGITSF